MTNQFNKILTADGKETGVFANLITISEIKISMEMDTAMIIS